MKQYFTKLILLSSLFIFTANAVWAHTGSVKGKINDNTTGKPVEGANVYIKELNLSAVTDVFGAFFLKGVADGHYVITVSHVGFEQAEEKIKIEDGVTTDFII